jgi:hypothetical protein
MTGIGRRRNTGQYAVAAGNARLPNLSIGINVPLYPEFERVPGYPVYYAPEVDSNYFFYDGMYWVFLRRLIRTP